MKILMIAPQPFYSERGTPINVRLLAGVLGEAGHSIDLLVFPTGQDIRLKNVNIRRLPNIFGVRHIPVGPSKIKLIMDILMILAVLKRCVCEEYDVIHGVEEGGFMAAVFSRVFRKASVLDLDSWISEQLKYSGAIRNVFLLDLVLSIEKWAIKNSSLVLTVCTSLTEKVKKISPNANIAQIEDIPLTGSDTRDIQHVEMLKERFGLKDCTRVVYTGNLEKYQGIDLLIDAWSIFISKEKSKGDHQLIIVGGLNKDIEAYKRISEAKHLGDSVCWAGQRPSSEMEDWMALGDVLVSPRSDGDNTPLKIFSYMAASRPIVATRRTTHTQVLDDSTAFLAEPEPEDFSEAIMKALNNREEALKKSDLAKKTVEIKYSYAAFSKKLLYAYSSIKQIV